MLEDQLLFFFIALVCEIAGTVSGFGSSVLFVPLAGLILPRPQVLGVTSLLHVFSNSSKLILFFKSIDKRIFLLFGIPSLLLTILGALLVSKVDSSVADISLGIFLMLLSLLLLVYPRHPFKATNANAIWTGSAAGFCAGLLGTGGAIRGAGLVAFGLEKEVFVATSAAIDFGVDFSRMWIYMASGFIPLRLLLLIPSLMLAAWLGTWLGKKILERISQELFRKIVLMLILVIGIWLVAKQMI